MFIEIEKYLENHELLIAEVNENVCNDRLLSLPLAVGFICLECYIINIPILFKFIYPMLWEN